MKTRFQNLSFLFLSILCFNLLVFSASAQQTKKISLQGFLKDANGKAVADGSQSMTFKLYTTATGGTAEWSEDQTLNVFGGVYSTHLGTNTNNVAGGVTEFGNLSWGAATYFVGVTVQGTELTPRTELTFAPYSLGSPKAQEVVCSGAVGDVKHSILNPTQFAAVNGSCWVAMDGRALATTDKLRQITGMTSLPNGGGLFIRSQEFSNSVDYDPERTSTTAIASYQDHTFTQHLHSLSIGFSASGGTSTNGSHSHRYSNGNQDGGETDSGTSERYQRPNNYTENTTNDGDHSHSVSVSGTVSGNTANANTGGGNETRPKNLNFWVYIRIN